MWNRSSGGGEWEWNSPLADEVSTLLLIKHNNILGPKNITIIGNYHSLSHRLNYKFTQAVHNGSACSQSLK